MRITRDGAEKVYAAAQKWVDCALKDDGSLFTPGKAIWSSRWLGELDEKFLNNPDQPGTDFLDKLQGQMRDSLPEVYQLMGEALYFYFLIVTAKNSVGEEKIINSVLNLSQAPVTIPPDLAAALTPGIANPGTAFHTFRQFQVGFLIQFVEQWKEQDLGERQRLLDDPWAFKDFMFSIRLRSSLFRHKQNTPRIQRQALLHLVFPDTFEAIVAVDHKEQIAKTFSDLVVSPTEDVDRQLEQIRPALEAKYGSGDHFFYRDEVRVQWDDKHKPKLWDKYVRRAKAYVDTGRLEIEEIEYKVRTGRRLAEAREAVLTGRDDWADLLKRALNPNDANYINWRLISNLNQWYVEQPDESLRALQAIWVQDDSSVGKRVRDFAGLFPSSVVSGLGTRANVASGLLMGLDVEKYPPFRVGVFNEAYQRTGYEQPEKNADEATLYEHALGFLDRFIEEASKRGLTLRHRLDAQSVVWAIKDSGDGIIIEDDETEDDVQTPLISDPWTPANIEALAEELLWEPQSKLQDIIRDLQEKGQVIFYGPPGTGKTYVAREIAKQCRLNGGDFEIVQFHPSYSYEDFVEGFRPTLTDSGQAGFELVPGPLRRIADKARNNERANYILVIDELNRGNVAKVFGELYFLLEYRDEEVRLQYGGEGAGFSLPSNLWFICTMNTADRSIALMDAALRRRFYFAPFFPNEPPVQGLLRRWLNKEEQDTLAAGLIDEANKNLNRDAGIGPSYFMRPGQVLDEDSVRRIWERAVVPYVEEQCFGDDAKLETFRFGALKRQIDGWELAEAETAGDSITEQASNAKPETD